MKTEAEVLDCSIEHIKQGHWKPGSLTSRDSEDRIDGHCAVGLVTVCIEGKNYIGEDEHYGEYEYPTGLRGPNKIVAEATIKALYDAIPEWFRAEKIHHWVGDKTPTFERMEDVVVSWNDHFDYAFVYQTPEEILEWFKEARKSVS